MLRRRLSLALLAVLLLSAADSTTSRATDQPPKVAVLDFADSSVGRLVSDKLSANLKREAGLIVLDRDQVGTAARGAGYRGSINLSVAEARDLGAALGCDFFIIGDAQTLRRSPSTGEPYYESYASIFLVSARTGRLIKWLRPNFQAANSSGADGALKLEIGSDDIRGDLLQAIIQTQTAERHERELTVAAATPVIMEAPEDEKSAEAEGLRLPRPYRRLTPVYPESAAKAEAEAIVDVVVDLDARGEVTKAEIARWAGFGLDQVTLDTVRRLHFFPAMRDGVPIPIRVLLRYNFRKPPR